MSKSGNKKYIRRLEEHIEKQTDKEIKLAVKNIIYECIFFIIIENKITEEEYNEFMSD